MSALNRREFLKSSLCTVSAFSIIPGHVLGRNGTQSANNKLNIAAVGLGGMGKHYLKNVESENIVALCDVDDQYSAKVYQTYSLANRYRDFRIMMEKEKEIDALVIGTPDHTHAIIAQLALEMGKHIYCAKPLTRTIYETRKLTVEARKAKVATQVSMQSNASEDHRLLAEWIWNGAIGKVREVHIWSNRPIWPQGLERPSEIPSVPPYLDWNLWIGPAPHRPYHPLYHPFKWRGWWDFGTGALGDMGCHAFDPVFRALKLGSPEQVSASSTKLYPDTAPVASIIHYDFPERQELPPVKLTWYDGGLEPQRPEELEPGRKFGDRDGGILFKGNEGMILAGGVGHSPRIIPEKKMREYEAPVKTIPRSPGHYKEWIEACKGGQPAGCNFDYAGPLTEAVLLGNVAIRSAKRLTWDSKNLKISNDEQANQFINEPCHNGWSFY